MLLRERCLRALRDGNTQGTGGYGFRSISVYHEQGMLDGRWIDAIVMERLCS